MVRVQIPATTANFGPGFDCIGAALGLYNYIEMGFAEKAEIIVQGEGEGNIAPDETNLVYTAAEKVLQLAKMKKPLKIVLENNIPLSRGLGSSAACIAGGIVAANRLVGDILSLDEMIRLATKMEGHPDNVVPALVGGFCLSTIHENRVIYKRLSIPPWLKFVVCVPDFHVKTQEARQVLPKTISFEDAVFNISRCAMLVASIALGEISDMNLFFEDRLHQPYRSHLIPGLDTILKTAKEKGAFASFLSGAGPSIVCLTLLERSKAVGQYMVDVLNDSGVKADYKVLSPSLEGAKILNP